MREDLLSIGQMANLNHITIATLRLYDDMGLLSPRYKDPQTGYRYYDIAQNARLDMIAYMKELGMSLAEIADVLRREDITLIESILIEKNKQMHREMRALRARHHAVERAIACIYLDNYDDEPRYAERLLDFCREHGYTVAGDYICEVLTEFNVFDSESRSMFLRLQVPVSFR